MASLKTDYFQSTSSTIIRFYVLLCCSRQKNTIPNQLNMELAIFMDPTAYSILTEVLDRQELVDVTFSVINQVQALYNLPSLLGPDRANGIQFSISTLEIQLRAPLNLPNFAGQQYEACVTKIYCNCFLEQNLFKLLSICHCPTAFSLDKN